MDFLNWHFSKGLKVYISGWENLLYYFHDYFSIKVLVNTLFSPWKRLDIKGKKSIFNWSTYVNDLSFNVTSRIVGFLVRISLIITALLVSSVMVILGLPGIILWFLFPPLTVFAYIKYTKSLEYFCQQLVESIENSNNPLSTLFTNKAGVFVLEHIGLDLETMTQESVTQLTLQSDKEYAGYSDILSHVIQSGIWSEDFWKKVNVLPDDMLFAAAIWDRKMTLAHESRSLLSSKKTKGIGIGLLYGYTPILDKYGTDLIYSSDSHTPHGREDLLDRIFRVLDSKTSVFLVGHAGIGKTAILSAIADHLDDAYKRLVEVNIVKLTEGVTDRNERKILIQNMLSEASSAGNVVLVIKDLPRLTDMKFEGVDYTDIFENHLEKRKVQLIAPLTPDEYEKHISRNSRLVKQFEKVEIEQLSMYAATNVLIDQAAELETTENVTIPIPIIRKMVTVSNSFSSDLPYPQKAIDLLVSTVSYVKNKGQALVTYDDVAQIASQKSGIPLESLTNEHKKLLSTIEDAMTQKLIGQKTAIKMISQSLRSRATGVGRNDKPIGSFLFLGPTGVGKTETARVLSDLYYGNTDILRFDMAEFVGFEGITKLIGSLHMNQPGVLTTAVKNKPAGMLLLDELEKASSEVFNVLLTLFDEGYIMDAFGRKVDFRNTFVISTSNAGSELIRELVQKGLTGEDLQQSVMEHILRERIFSPEFINRFDGVVVYEPLSQEDLTQIAHLKLGALKQRVAEKDIQLEFHDELAFRVAEDGYDPLFGARPMNRVIDMVISDVFSKAILSEDISAGDKVILIPGENKLEYRLERVSEFNGDS